MKVGITDRGYPGFEKSVNRFKKNLIDYYRRLVAETAEMIATELKARAPVGTIDGGNLRRSIEVEYSADRLTATIRIGASYAIFVNYGTGIYAEGGDGRKTPWVYYSEQLGRFVWTRGIKPQNFWRPSIEKGLNHFKDGMNK